MKTNSSCLSIEHEQQFVFGVLADDANASYWMKQCMEQNPLTVMLLNFRRVSIEIYHFKIKN